MWSLSQLLSLASIAQEQPQTVCKWMGVAVFQYKFIYKNRWQPTFEPQTIICCPPSLGSEIPGGRGHWWVGTGKRVSSALYLLNFRWTMKQSRRFFAGSWASGSGDWEKIQLRETDWRVIHVEIDIIVELLKQGHLGNGWEWKEGQGLTRRSPTVKEETLDREKK